jgi:hypothetical protein
MPRGNGTGPLGMGPMTGRRTGYCAGYGMPGNPNRRSDLGMGPGQMRGWRRGCGRHSMYDSPVSPRWSAKTPFTMPVSEDEKQVLQKQAEILQNRLNEIKGRLDELGA